MNPALILPPDKQVDQICQLFEPSEEAIALRQERQSPADFLQRLVENGYFVDAVRFLACAVPPRTAVGWACICARRRLQKDTPESALSALAAAESWVRQPYEDNRRKAGAAGEASLDTPAGCAAMAAFFSGGSLAPPDAPDTPPAPSLTPKMSAAAITLAVVGFQPEKAPETYRQFLKLGIDVANRAAAAPA